MTRYLRVLQPRLRGFRIGPGALKPGFLNKTILNFGCDQRSDIAEAWNWGTLDYELPAGWLCGAINGYAWIFDVKSGIERVCQTRRNCRCFEERNYDEKRSLAVQERQLGKKGEFNYSRSNLCRNQRILHHIFIYTGNNYMKARRYPIKFFLTKFYLSSCSRIASIYCKYGGNYVNIYLPSTWFATTWK